MLFPALAFELCMPRLSLTMLTVKAWRTVQCSLPRLPLDPEAVRMTRFCVLRGSRTSLAVRDVSGIPERQIGSRSRGGGAGLRRRLRAGHDGGRTAAAPSAGGCFDWSSIWRGSNIPWRSWASIGSDMAELARGRRGFGRAGITPWPTPATISACRCSSRRAPTPRWRRWWTPDAHRGPLVCMHTYPLPFHLWADKYRTGQSLVVTDVQQVPSDVLARRTEVPQPHALLPGRPASPPHRARGRGPCCWTPAGTCSKRRPPTSASSAATKGWFRRPRRRSCPASASRVDRRTGARARDPVSPSRFDGRRTRSTPTKSCCAAPARACGPCCG